MFLETIVALQTLHPSDLFIPCSDSLLNIQLDLNLELSLDSFMSTFIQLSHLSLDDFLNIIFEHLQNLFNPKDSTNAFTQLSQVGSSILMSIARALSIRSF
jgi:hypothetical protein